jgi:hypothetical protein
MLASRCVRRHNMLLVPKPFKIYTLHPTPYTLGGTSELRGGGTELGLTKRWRGNETYFNEHMSPPELHGGVEPPLGRSIVHSV